MAAFERGTALKDEEVFEPTLTSPAQELGEAVVSLQYGLRDTSAAMFFVQSIGEKRKIALRNHVREIAWSSSMPTFNCRRHREWKDPDFGSVGSSRS